MSNLDHPGPLSARAQVSRAAFIALYAAMDQCQRDEVMIPCTADGPAHWDSLKSITQIRKCRLCPVKDLCLKAGQESENADGVWGGKLFGRSSDLGAKGGLAPGVRRRQVKQLTDQGFGATAIANKLGLTTNTVRFHQRALKEGK